MKKLFTTKLLLAILMSMVGTRALSHDFEMANNEGKTIYYVITSDSEVAVSYQGSSYNTNTNDYTGNIIIPESVIYSGNTYKVTSINDEAFRLCINLTSITIPYSVTSIGDYAFVDCTSLTSIIIPNSVSSIGNDAFANTAWYKKQLAGLVYAGKVVYKYKGTMPENTSINLEEGTLGIAGYAFMGCSGLTSIIIPNSVTRIGDYAFVNCSNLSSITIPNSVLSIGSWAFHGTGWYNSQPDGMIYAGKVAYRYKGTMLEDTSINLEEGTSGIADGAFSSCSNMTSIIIPNSVTRIGDYAFASCSSLSSITIPNSVIYIGSSAFQGCSGLTSINIGNSVKRIGTEAFRNCSRLTSIIIPNSVTSIGKEAFTGCIFLTSVTFHCSEIGDWFSENSRIKEIIIGDEVKGISHHAFKNCTSLTFVSIPNSVIDIGNQAFSGCSGLTSVSIGNGLTNISDEAFSGCSGLTSITIGNGVTSIGNEAFRGCSALTSVALSNNLTNIGKQAFRECSSLTSITIPNSIATIGTWAFYGCNGLTSVALHCESIGDWFSYLTSIKELIIGEEVTSIGNYAFSGCNGLTSVTIPNRVTSIGNQAFYNTRLKSITIGTGVLSIGSKAFKYSITSGHADGESPIKVIWLTNTPPTGYNNVGGIMNYVSNDSYANLSKKEVYPFLSSLFEVNGLKYVPVSPSERTCDVIDCIYDETIENVNIGESVSYKGIDLTVKNVKCYTFYDNLFVRNVNLSFEGALEDCAFQNCSVMTTASLGEKITSIGENAFFGCSTLPNIVIPQSVMSIGHYAFAGCTKLTKVNIADSKNDDTILSLGCNGSLPLFADCPLEEVYIGRNISYSTSSNFGYSPFYRNTSLKEVTITNKETEISTNEFYGCISLQNVTIGDGVTTIGDRAFSGCSSLDYFACGSHVTNIGQEAFSDCTAMTKFISHAMVPPVCGSQALDDINKWTCTLQVPENSINLYKAADQWKDFFFVEPTGIEKLEKGKKEVLEVVKYYNLKGQPSLHPYKGVNIIDGKKVLVK